MTTEEAVAAERAAIVRTIRAEAESYTRQAKDLERRIEELPTQERRRVHELREKAGALRGMAAIIEHRETEGRP
jgi:DICT domain-containing protein